MINFGLFIVTIWGLLSRFWKMLQATFLSGVDAYYYALQIKFFKETGALKIPDSSPLLHLMGQTAKLGLSSELTIYLWTIFIQLCCAISIFIAYRLIYKKDSSNPILPVLFAWVILSPTITFTCIEFPKFAFSLILLPLWPIGLVNKRLWLVSLGAIILSCISHLTMIGLLFLILLGVTLIGFTRLNLSFLKKPIIVTGIAVLVLVMSFILSKFFLLADLKRIQLRGLQPILWTFFSRAELPTFLKVELFFSVVISIFLLVIAIKDKTKVTPRFWAPFTFFLLLIPLGSQEIMGIPERLCLMLPFITICSLIGTPLKISVLVRKLLYSSIFLIFLLVVIFPDLYLDLVHPKRLNPDYQLFNQVTQAIERQDIPMLIAHQGLNYYYKYQTMKESFPYEPEPHWPKQKIWRIVYGVTPSEWSYYLPEKYLWGSGYLFSLSGPYSLIREDCWNVFCNKVKLSSNEELKDLVFESWLNPSQKRPEFVRKRAEEDNGGEFSAYPKK